MYAFLQHFDPNNVAGESNTIPNRSNPEENGPLDWGNAKNEPSPPETFKFSPGFDPRTLKKKDYLVFKNHYKCPHEGCTKILVRQCWPLHVEMDHINGQKHFKKSKDQIFVCLDCPMQFNSRIARSKHRAQAHSKINRKRDIKELDKQGQ